MGIHEETVAANAGGEVNGHGETKAHHVGFSPQENRGGAKVAVGSGSGSAEEGGVD
jgi:hypothetical protein